MGMGMVAMRARARACAHAPEWLARERRDLLEVEPSVDREGDPPSLIAGDVEVGGVARELEDGVSREDVPQGTARQAGGCRRVRMRSAHAHGTCPWDMDMDMCSVAVCSSSARALRYR